MQNLKKFLVLYNFNKIKNQNNSAAHYKLPEQKDTDHFLISENQID